MSSTSIRLRAVEMESARRMVEQSPTYAIEQILAHYARMASTAAAALHIIRAGHGRCVPSPSDEVINYCLATIREDYAHSIGVEPAWPTSLLPEVE